VGRADLEHQLVGVAQVEHEAAAGAAVDGGGPGVAGLGGQLVGGDLPDHPGVAGVGPGVQHLDPRRPDPGDDQIAALQRLAVAVVAGWQRALEQAFQPKWWSSLPAVGSSDQPTTWP
jgi:hypothetical protein